MGVWARPLSVIFCNFLWVYNNFYTISVKRLRKGDKNKEQGLVMHIHLELDLEKLEYLKFPFILTLGMSLKGPGHQAVIFRYTQPTSKLRQ